MAKLLITKAADTVRQRFNDAASYTGDAKHMAWGGCRAVYVGQHAWEVSGRSAGLHEDDWRHDSFHGVQA